MSSNAKWLAQNLELLKGHTIDSVVADIEEGFVGFTCSKGSNNLRVWVDADSEGNHCGAVSIERHGGPRDGVPVQPIKWKEIK